MTLTLRRQTRHRNMLLVILTAAQCIAKDIGPAAYQEDLQPPTFGDLFNHAVPPTPRLSRLHHVRSSLLGHPWPDNRFSETPAVSPSPSEAGSHHDHRPPTDLVKVEGGLKSAHKVMTSSPPRLNFRKGVRSLETNQDFLADRFARHHFNPFTAGVRQILENTLPIIFSRGVVDIGESSGTSFTTGGVQTPTFSGAHEFFRTSDPRFDQSLSEDDVRKRSSAETACKPRRLSLEWLINALRRGKVCIKRANILRWGAGGR